MKRFPSLKLNHRPYRVHLLQSAAPVSVSPVSFADWRCLVRNIRGPTPACRVFLGAGWHIRLLLCRDLTLPPCRTFCRSDTISTGKEYGKVAAWCEKRGTLRILAM